MSKSSTTWTLLIPLFMLLIGALAGPCLPCQMPNRRHASRDHRLPVRGVHSPNITNPNANTIWNTGSDVVVTWDTTGVKYSEEKGMLILQHHKKETIDEHPDIDHPLASNFDLSQGSITVRCPFVEPRNDYIVVLLGDSGNHSPQFTIKN